MTTPPLAPFPEQTLTPAKYISRPPSGSAYLISDNHVAKPHRWFWLKNFLEHYKEGIARLEHELAIMQELYCHGLPVPKPEGIFAVRIPYNSYRKKFEPYLLDQYPALVMEYIKETQPLNEMDYGEEGRLARKKYWEEIRKAEALGFGAGDIRGEQNGLWQPVTQRVFMIDFESWRKK